MNVDFRKLVPILLVWMSLPLVPVAAQEGNHDRVDYLPVVRAYADCLLKYGRDDYGSVHSPLIAEALDRRTLRLLEGDALKQVQAIRRDQWGLRPGDRMLTGANPQHCENLYQVLYALTAATGEPKYAREADESLRWFFGHCQSPQTGLLCWGEHAGWDFRTEAQAQYSQGNTHEFFRPWVLWDRCWELAPQPCQKFALGLWEHQIADHATGDYSRHAAIDRHGPGRGAPYPRHGGFYILTWAKAYEKTQDPVFLQAIDVVIRGLGNDRRSGGMVVSRNRSSGKRVAYDLSVTISVWEAAALVPEDLADKMREFAKANDAAYAAAHPETEAGAESPEKKDEGVQTRPNLWSSGYGGAGGEVAGRANQCLMRYAQVKLAPYKETAIGAADRYLNDDVNLSFPVYPGTVGKVILLMLGAHELTGEARYLQRADALAQQALTLFMDDSCPLPRATHQHDHYEAITEADTLMMALLRLWAVQQTPPVALPLTYTDR